MEIPLKQLKNLIATLDAGGVSELEYEDEKIKLRLVLGRAAPALATAAVALPASTVATSVAPSASDVTDPDLVVVTSPFVGTFYRAPSPEAPAFVELGALVKKGQTLCIVEAMKLMNEIEADDNGTVEEVLVENGASVEFGQKLFKIRRVG
ncbi:MAG: acetyl-CoA carboxylase biotin carboxyl carrier protein [Polyangiaceae bacterium]|nr:acetyl-CoA carboxylase biotin carboxyl carrier protein [Polyangiaceae bacterium]